MLCISVMDVMFLKIENVLTFHGENAIFLPANCYRNCSITSWTVSKGFSFMCWESARITFEVFLLLLLRASNRWIWQGRGGGWKWESGRRMGKENESDKSKREKQMGPESQRGVWPGRNCAIHSSSSFKTQLWFWWGKTRTNLTCANNNGLKLSVWLTTQQLTNWVGAQAETSYHWF